MSQGNDNIVMMMNCFENQQLHIISQIFYFSLWVIFKNYKSLILIVTISQSLINILLKDVWVLDLRQWVSYSLIIIITFYFPIYLIDCHTFQTDSHCWKKIEYVSERENKKIKNKKQKWSYFWRTMSQNIIHVRMKNCPWQYLISPYLSAG